MYTGFYKLSGRPFQLTPDPRFYFNSRTHKKAMAYLIYGLSQGEGFIVITGEVGAGKTTVVGNLLNTLDGHKYVAAKIVTTQLEADNILRMIAAALDIDHEGLDKAAVLGRLEAFLRDAHAQDKRVLLIVDEAQNLPNAALEELRMLSNYQIGETAMLQSFLVGQPQFRDRIAQDPDLEQVRQRIIATHHLMPLADADETRDYIEHRLNQVDWAGDPAFTDGAIKAIHTFSNGVPRRLNTLCSRLLLYGFLEGLHAIDEDVVAAVIAELGYDSGGQNNQPPAGAAPSYAPLPYDGAQAVNGSLPLGGAPPATFEEMAQRLVVLEQYIAAHEHVISRALDITSNWLDIANQRKSDKDNKGNKGKSKRD